MFGFFKKLKDKIVSSEPKFHIRGVSELNPSEKEKLKAQLEVLENRLSEDYNKQKSRIEKEKEKHDGVCPKCKSVNVNNRIKRIQGEIKGSSSGSSFFGTGSSSGSLRGSLDTNEVNKCNDCQHEWKIYDHKPHYVGIYDVIDYPNTVMRFLERTMQGKIDWNPNDLNEKFATKEEKIQDDIRRTVEGFYGLATKKYFGDLSLELMQYIVDVESNKYPSLYRYEIEKWNQGNKKILRDHLGIKFLHEM